MFDLRLAVEIVFFDIRWPGGLSLVFTFVITDRMIGTIIMLLHKTYSVHMSYPQHNSRGRLEVETFDWQ